jgi:hypothetical protein
LDVSTLEDETTALSQNIRHSVMQCHIPEEQKLCNFHIENVGVHI